MPTITRNLLNKEGAEISGLLLGMGSAQQEIVEVSRIELRWRLAAKEKQRGKQQWVECAHDT
jgi:hypothetical protein